MRIPTKLKIGAFDWEVKQDEGVANEGQIFGSTHHVKQRIFIEPNETQQKKEHTLLHEIMHAVWWQMGMGERYKETKNFEEEVVSSLSMGVYQVMKDNNLLNNAK